MTILSPLLYKGIMAVKSSALRKPILGAVLAGFVYNALFGDSDVSELERMRETV